MTWFAPEPEVVLTCPFGGESLIPRQTTYIAWTATTGDLGTWTVEYKADGTSWNTIVDNLPGQDRTLSWAPPTGISQAEFRVTNSALQLSDMTNAPVSIVSPPLNLTTTELCATSLQFSWSPNEEAVRYAVFRFDSEQMLQVGVTADTLWQFTGLQADEEFLLSVVAITESNHRSKRAFALEVTHSGLNPACELKTLVVWGELSTHENEPAVEVRWEVEQEQNVQRYEVERGIMIAGGIEWFLVDSVKANGASLTTIRYQLSDLDAVAHGLTYYRIRMIDNDGMDQYSDEFVHERSSVSSNTSPVANGSPSFSLIQNPVGQTISIRSEIPAARTLNLYDITGRLRASFQLQKGTNFFECPAELGAGMYLLKVADSATNEVVKMIRR